MNPMTIAMLGQLGLTGAGMLMQDDPNKEWQRRLDATGQILSPGALNKDALAFFQNWQNSPAHATGMRNILVGGNMATTSLNRSLGAAGLGGTGIGAAAKALGGSAASFKTGDLMANAWQQAMSQALAAAQARISGTGMVPQQRFGAGDQMAGLQEALSRYIMAMWKARNPGLQGPELGRIS